MNSLFNKIAGIVLVVGALALAGQARAVTMNAVYYASCKREVGVIIHVGEEAIAILTMDGVIKTIRRFDIIYLAQYPVGDIPIGQVANAGEYPGIVIRTLFGKEIVELVRGWPVNFSEDKIAFLSLEGQETIIDRDSIWSVERTPFAASQKFKHAATDKLEFVHPYPFSTCAPDHPEGTKRIYPQQLLGDRLIIKNELDRLMAGYLQLLDYEKDQKFYPVPQLYQNETSLGLWYNYGSRHAISRKRSNSMVPAVISKLSEGPFGFQRVLVTGAAPLDFTVHEEPQTQFYYRLKADYVHFSYFYDIDRLLIGEESYKWRMDDLDRHDDRWTEVHHISGGFDYGAFAIGYTLPTLQYAVRVNDSFFIHRVDLQTFDGSYEDKNLLAHVFFGGAIDRKDGGRFRGPEEEEDENEPEEVRQAREALAKEEELKPDFTARVRYVRANLRLKTMPLKPFFSMIYRSLRLYHGPDSDGDDELTYASKSVTGSVYLRYQIDEEIGVTAYLALEGRKSRYGTSKFEEEASDRFPKAGINWTLSF